MVGRRTLIIGGAAIAAAAGTGLWFNAREARRRGDALNQLNESHRLTLEALGEALLPGAREAGIAHFVDAQLRNAPEDCLLTLRYFDWPPPYGAFYAGGLTALEALSQTRHQMPFHQLSPEQAGVIVGGLLSGQAEDWQGPPAPLFYLSVRSDAVDVVYGTVEGFEKLGIPYMAHIEPQRPW